MPVLIGWSSVTGTLDWAPVVLFAIIFYWTPPHFWALAIRYRDDYAAAEVPMLPVVESLRTHLGADPRLHAAALGPHGAVLAGGRDGPPLPRVGHRPRRRLHLVRRPAAADARSRAPASPAAGGAAEVEVRATAMRLFTWSITYITLLFGAMAVDQLVRSGW